MRRRKAKTKAQPQARAVARNELVGLGLIVFSLLGLGGLFLAGTGLFGRYLTGSLRFLAGNLAFSLPLLLGLAGVATLTEKAGAWRKVGLLTFIFLLVGALLHLLLPPNQRLFANVLPLAEAGAAGGLLGGLLGALLWTLFGGWGSYIVLSALFLVGFLELIEVPLTQFFSRLKQIAGLFFGKLISSVANFFLGVWDELCEAIAVVSREEQEAASLEPDAMEPPVVEVSEPPPLAGDIHPEVERSAAAQPAKEEKREPREQPRLQLSYPLPSPQVLPRVGKRQRRVRVGPDERVTLLEETLQSFGVDAKVVEVNQGPVITRYELEPAPGVKVSKIVSLADDLALSMAAPDVRIEAPIPGKARVGIEVPNKEVSSVYFRELIDDGEFAKRPGKLVFTLGRDIAGAPTYADLSKMPHLLIAGATGSGKSGAFCSSQHK